MGFNAAVISTQVVTNVSTPTVEISDFLCKAYSIPGVVRQYICQ